MASGVTRIGDDSTSLPGTEVASVVGGVGEARSVVDSGADSWLFGVLVGSAVVVDDSGRLVGATDESLVTVP
ncbi:hypothetical protein GCM10007304_48850 [Rhodococcoides trifolii]|uniref:Uncharacterized protein n=1 Tax=Rhodococcoides trifolii TaxID=908250 RepID=A0A917G9D6_9NOCA|nr:hypothetical protein GCM10007304_48850 [Rhodococcus trifolii]